MKKIISLFKRDYGGNRQVYDEVVPGAEWVIAGEGVATEKFDGTACMVRDNLLYRRYDRKIKKKSRWKVDAGEKITVDDFKDPPFGWESCEEKPDLHTFHWPGWLAISHTDPSEKWHRAAFDNSDEYSDGTYELVGPKVQKNPYSLLSHNLWKHGERRIIPDPPRNFGDLKKFFEKNYIEGIVWHHSDGRMVKIKRKDFGFKWPVEVEA